MFQHTIATVAVAFNMPDLPRFLDWLKTEHELSEPDLYTLLTLLVAEKINRSGVLTAIPPRRFEDYEYVSRNSDVLYNDCKPYLSEIDHYLNEKLRNHVAQFGRVLDIDVGYDFIVLYIETYKC